MLLDQRPKCGSAPKLLADALPVAQIENGAVGSARDPGLVSPIGQASRRQQDTDRQAHALWMPHTCTRQPL